MTLTYGELMERAAAVAAEFAAARSARNLLSRRKAEEEQDERQAERGRRRRARKNARELEELLRRKVRVRITPGERPKVGMVTARSLYHRAADMLLGVSGLTDARGPDGLYSIHFAFTARGFASTKGRRWRRGEAERAARYIVREDGLEGGELGWWSNIADDRNELVAFHRAVEALERHDRSNANVYISEVIALPSELSARQRRRAVGRICRFFERRGLPFTVAIHLPDPSGDQRNFHCHILYSMRSCERIAPYEWSFGVAKADDINTPDGIVARRVAAVRAINTTLHAAGIAKRYTHLSNKARRMAAAQEKLGQQRTWANRRLAALDRTAGTLRRIETGLQKAIGTLGSLAARMQHTRSTARQRLEAIGEPLWGRPTLAGADTAQRLHAGLRQAGAGAQRSLHRCAGDVMARGHAVGVRLAGIGQRAGRRRALEIRQSALAITSERLCKHVASVRVSTLRAVLTLGRETSLRADLNKARRIGLAGRGAIARLREEAIRQRDLIKAVNDRLANYKVLLDRIRIAADSAAGRKRSAIVSALQGARARLGAAGRAPRLVRWQSLGTAHSVIDKVLRAVPERLQVAQWRAQTRMTSTVHWMEWTVRGANTALGNLRHEAIRGYQLDNLIGRSATVEGAMIGLRSRLGPASQQAAKILADRLSRVDDSLARGMSRLAQANDAHQRVVNAAAYDARRAGDGQERKPAEHGPGTAGAATPAVKRKAELGLPASRPLNTIETLRKLVPQRTPETDLHGRVLPGTRRLLPGPKSSKIAAIWQRLRGEVKNREIDVHTELLQQALRRLAVSKAIVTRGEDGRYVVDDRGLFDEERRALHQSADYELVRAGLAKLWHAQERRRQLASAAAASKPVSPTPIATSEPDISLEVQKQFLARLKGKGR